jgi:hypothetical protein
MRLAFPTLATLVPKLEFGSKVAKGKAGAGERGTDFSDDTQSSCWTNPCPT